MRAVSSPPAFGPSFGPAEAPGAGPDAPGESATGGASGPAPFAAMLATHLVTPGLKSAPQLGSKTSDENATDNDDEQVGAGPDPSLILPALRGLAAGMPADAAAVAAVPAPLVSAARTAGTTPAADVRHVSRDTNDLAPALRERLGRVVARMQREYGHDVRIAEAGRTQARQDYLFAQGRTRSGPVVTWTRDSAHTRGRAVDVTIDGGYDDATAFARLQQIAQAEGLRTLGARDPGHLELPRGVPGEVPALADGDGAARVTVESFGVRTEPAPLPGSAQPRSVPAVAGVAPTGVAAVAPVAQVAGVAGVAVVAPVAQVAAPGVGASVAASHAAPNAVLRAAPIPTPNAAPGAVPPSHSVDHALSPAPRRVPEDASARVPSGGTGRDTSHSSTAPLRGITGPQTGSAVQAPAAASTSGDGDGRGDRAPDRGRGSDEAVAPPTSVPPRLTNVPGTAPERAAPAPATPSERPQAPPLLGAVAAERIARVLDAQAAAAPRTVSHLTLRVERAEGGDDRIRLDLRGRAVEARIDVADLGSADQLAARAPELRAALARHGFTTDDVRVRSPVGGVVETPRPDGQASADRVLGAGAAHTFGDSTPRGGAFEQSSRDAGERKERASDHPASEDPRANDGGRGERRPGDQRHGRRPPPDAYLDGLATSPTGRSRR